MLSPLLEQLQHQVEGNRPVNHSEPEGRSARRVRKLLERSRLALRERNEQRCREE